LYLGDDIGIGRFPTGEGLSDEFIDHLYSIEDKNIIDEIMKKNDR